MGSNMLTKSNESEVFVPTNMASKGGATFGDIPIFRSMPTVVRDVASWSHKSRGLRIRKLSLIVVARDIASWSHKTRGLRIRKLSLTETVRAAASWSHEGRGLGVRRFFSAVTVREIASGSHESRGLQNWRLSSTVNVRDIACWSRKSRELRLRRLFSTASVRNAASWSRLLSGSTLSTRGRKRWWWHRRRSETSEIGNIRSTRRFLGVRIMIDERGVEVEGRNIDRRVEGRSWRNLTIGHEAAVDWTSRRLIWVAASSNRSLMAWLHRRLSPRRSHDV